MLEKRALRKIAEGAIELPSDLQLLEKTALLWPEKPDDSAVEIARHLEKILEGKIVAVVGYADSCPLKNVEYRRIGEKDAGKFGYPKQEAVGKLSGITASIDLSPAFELKLSSLPVLAGIRLRMGRDDGRISGFYNVLMTGKSGREIETLIGAMIK